MVHVYVCACFGYFCVLLHAQCELLPAGTDHLWYKTSVHRLHDYILYNKPVVTFYETEFLLSSLKRQVSVLFAGDFLSDSNYTLRQFHHAMFDYCDMMSKLMLSYLYLGFGHRL